MVALEEEIARWTDSTQLAEGRRCRAQKAGVVAAGVPIGSDAFTLGTMQAKLASHERAHQQLRRLGDDFCKIAYLLLRFCLNARIGYWTRTVPPRVLRDLCRVLFA